MHGPFITSLMLNLLLLAAAQKSATSTPAVSVPSYMLSTETGSSNQPSSESGNAAGASGPDDGSFSLSSGGLIAIIVVVVVVVIFGVTSTVLFYLAKKRSWALRERVRNSARRVASAMTPRRSEFPKGALAPRKGSKSTVNIDKALSAQRINHGDLEKGKVSEQMEKTEKAVYNGGKADA